MRVTIKKHNQAYLKLIGNQMEVEDPSEVINYLLLELRKMGYSFSSPLQLPIAQAYPTVQAPQEIQKQHTPAVADPVISRMAALIEDF